MNVSTPDEDPGLGRTEVFFTLVDLLLENDYMAPEEKTTKAKVNKRD